MAAFKVTDKTTGEAFTIPADELDQFQDPVLYVVEPLRGANVADPEGRPTALSPEETLARAQAGDLNALPPGVVADATSPDVLPEPDDGLGKAVAFGAGVYEAIPFVGGIVSDALYGDQFSLEAKETYSGYYTGGFATGTGLMVAGLGVSGLSPAAGTGTLAKIGIAGAENAVWGAGLAVNDAYLARNKPGMTAEAMLWNVGKAGIRDFFIGAGLGAVGVGAAKAYRSLKPSASARTASAYMDNMANMYDEAGKSADFLSEVGQRGRDAAELVMAQADNPAPWQKLVSEYDTLVNSGKLTNKKFRSWLKAVGRQADESGLGGQFSIGLARSLDDDVAALYATGSLPLDASYDVARSAAIGLRAHDPAYDMYRHIAVQRAAGLTDPDVVLAKWGPKPNEIGLLHRGYPLEAQIAEMQVTKAPVAEKLIAAQSSPRAAQMYLDMAKEHHQAIASIATELKTSVGRLIPRADVGADAAIVFAPSYAASSMPKFTPLGDSVRANMRQAYRESKSWGRQVGGDVARRRFGAATDDVDELLWGSKSTQVEDVVPKGGFRDYLPKGASEWAMAGAGVAGAATGNPALAAVGGVGLVKRLLKLHARDFMLKRYPSSGVGRLAAADAASKFVGNMFESGPSKATQGASAIVKRVGDWLRQVAPSVRRVQARGASELLQLWDDDPKDPQALFEKRREEVLSMSQTQGGVEAAQRLMGGAYGGAHPQLVEAMGTKLQAIADFLAQRLPPEQSKPLLGTVAKVPHSMEDISTWARYWGYAMDPSTIVDELEAGIVTPEAGEVMQNLYPEMRELMLAALAGDEEDPPAMTAQKALELAYVGIDIGDPVWAQVADFQATHAQAAQAQAEQLNRQRSLKLRADLQAQMTPADRMATDLKRNA